MICSFIYTRRVNKKFGCFAYYQIYLARIIKLISIYFRSCNIFLKFRGNFYSLSNSERFPEPRNFFQSVPNKQPDGNGTRRHLSSGRQPDVKEVTPLEDIYTLLLVPVAKGCLFPIETWSG